MTKASPGRPKKSPVKKRSPKRTNANPEGLFDTIRDYRLQRVRNKRLQIARDPTKEEKLERDRLEQALAYIMEAKKEHHILTRVKQVLSEYTRNVDPDITEEEKETNITRLRNQAIKIGEKEWKDSQAEEIKHFKDRIKRAGEAGYRQKKEEYERRNGRGSYDLLDRATKARHIAAAKEKEINKIAEEIKDEIKAVNRYAKRPRYLKKEDELTYRGIAGCKNGEIVIYRGGIKQLQGLLGIIIRGESADIGQTNRYEKCQVRFFSLKDDAYPFKSRITKDGSSVIVNNEFAYQDLVPAYLPAVNGGINLRRDPRKYELMEKEEQEIDKLRRDFETEYQNATPEWQRTAGKELSQDILREQAIRGGIDLNIKFTRSQIQVYKGKYLVVQSPLKKFNFTKEETKKLFNGLEFRSRGSSYVPLAAYVGEKWRDLNISSPTASPTASPTMRRRAEDAARNTYNRGRQAATELKNYLSGWM